MRLGRREGFAEFMSKQGRSPGRWGSRQHGQGYTFQDVIDQDQGDDDGPDTRGVLLTLPADVVDWITERADQLGMSASQVVQDAIEVRAALAIAPQLTDLVRGGVPLAHE